MALSKIDSANMIEDVPQSKIDNNINFRNLIINGGMDIAQRGTSQASITTSGYYTVDRYRSTISSSGTWTISQSTDVPSSQGFAKSFKMDCTTADASLSSSDFITHRQIIEGQNLQYLKKGTASAESTTCSFWVKSNKTGTYIAELHDVDNARTISKSYTIDAADTWEKKSVTFAGDTTGAFDNDSAGSLYLNFWLAAGSNFTSGTLATSWENITNANRAVGQVNLADNTANEWYVTGIQLEAGSVASDFEFLPVDVNLQRCQRYFTKLYGTMYGGVYSTSTSFTGGILPVEMRVNPTASYDGVRTTTGLNSYFTRTHAQYIMTATNGYVTGLTANAEL